MLSAARRAALRDGLVIPAHPLALRDGALDEAHQRGLTDYYLHSGADGVAVGVHTTQFEIHDPAIGLYEPVLRLAAEQVASWRDEHRGADPLLVAGVLGPTERAVAEAQVAQSLGYHLALVATPGWGEAPESDILAGVAAVGEVLPVFGFCLQEAVAKRRFGIDFWRDYVSIESVVAIKLAPFDRYATHDIIRAVVEVGRAEDIALYTGNDDTIVTDLLTPYRIGETTVHIVGGLLGQWAVWTPAAVALHRRVRAIVRSGGPVPLDLLTLGAELTDANSAVFDAQNRFVGSIAGVNEVLAREGLMASSACLSDAERLSPGQAEALDRVTAEHPRVVGGDARSRPVAAQRAATVVGHRKGMPVDAADLTVEDLAAQRRDLFTGGFTTPLLTLDRAALTSNQVAMAAWTQAQGVSLAPHGKTTMAPALFAEQLQHGAWGLTVATVAQARVAVAAGVSRVLIANEVVDPAELRWIAQQVRDPELMIAFWVDSVEGVHRAAEAFAEVGARGDVLVEWGAPGGRTGCRSSEAALAVAAAVEATPALRLIGVAGFEGAIPAGPDGMLETVDAFVSGIGELAVTLDGLGHFDQASEVLLSAGGSLWFDRVSEILTSVTLTRATRVVLRSGCYLTHDHGFYAAGSPAARSVSGAPVLRPALELWAQVVSRPEVGLALLDAGRRDAPHDVGLPVALRRARGGALVPLDGTEVTALNDQHLFLRVPATVDLAVGDWVGLGISHPCTAFDRWRLVAVVEGTTVIDVIETMFG